MPFAVALQKTGGVALAVKGLMDIGGGYGPHMMLGCLFVSVGGYWAIYL